MGIDDLRRAVALMTPAQQNALLHLADLVEQLPPLDEPATERLAEADELDELGQRLAEEAACYLQRAAELRIKISEEK
ncbi:MAG TPA: hypothetical protein VFS21_09175 [Roseiflexaceae bacterium]|nr:hypothetical protein [Roseiflexaceae bacterium]